MATIMIQIFINKTNIKNESEIKNKKDWAAKIDSSFEMFCLLENTSILFSMMLFQTFGKLLDGLLQKKRKSKKAPVIHKVVQ